MAIGTPAAMIIGGATSSGPTKGIYHVEVTDAALGTSKKKGTPFIELTLTVKDDPDNKAKEGKTLLKQKFYGPSAEHDAEKAAVMLGMLRRGIFKGFNIPWPKAGTALDARKFLGKSAFVLVDKENNPQDPDDVRMEVKRISPERNKLEGAVKADVDAPEAGTTAEKPAAAARRR
jgi:hypothetical protein